MKFKGIEVTGNFEVREGFFCFEIWQNGKRIYIERTDGDNYWGKYKYDENGNCNYYEDRDGYLWKKEFDDKGCVIYYEKSNGKIVDHRPKNKPKTKMVFRLWKFLEDQNLTSRAQAVNILHGWVQECEGRTREEIGKSGFYVDDSWFVEENNNVNSK